MTDIQIRCFLESAKYLNFTKASQVLYISQPALSRHIINLEEELNAKLFERTSNKRVSLTVAGEEFFDLFYRFNNELQELKKKYITYSTDPLGHFSFGFFQSWDIGFFMSEMIETFQREHPGVDVPLQSLAPSEMCARLENGLLDIALMPWEYLPETRNIKWEHVVDIQNHVLLSRKFMEKHPEIRHLEDLKDTTFFFTPESIEVSRKKLSGFLQDEFGFLPKSTILPNTTTVLNYVNAGLGVMLSDSFGLNSQSREYKKLTMKTPRRVYILWPASVKHKLPSKIASEIRDILQKKQEDIPIFFS